MHHATSRMAKQQPNLGEARTPAHLLFSELLLLLVTYAGNQNIKSHIILRLNRLQIDKSFLLRMCLSQKERRKLASTENQAGVVCKKVKRRREH